MQKRLVFVLFALFLAVLPKKSAAQQPVESPEETTIEAVEADENFENTEAENFENTEAAPPIPAPKNGPERRVFDPSGYEKAVAGIDYSKDFAPPEPRPKTWDAPKIDLGKWAAAFKWLFIALGAALIGWMLFQFKKGPLSRKIEPFEPIDAASIDGLEGRHSVSDFEKMAREAAEKGQFALAVRFLFLAVLKKASQRGHLVWTREKTNRDYLRELSGKPFQADFRRAAQVFDRVWYGEEPIERDDFEQKMRPALEAVLLKMG